MVLTCTHNICFEQKYENSKNNSTENCHFYSREKSLYIAWACFRNGNWYFLSLKRQCPAFSKRGFANSAIVLVYVVHDFFILYLVTNIEPLEWKEDRSRIFVLLLQVFQLYNN